MTKPYPDRVAGGDALARELTGYVGHDNLVVLGLPRGGVPVAARVADSLAAALDVLVVRKLGLPGQTELAMGAVAGVGEKIEVVRNTTVLDQAAVEQADFNSVLHREIEQLRRRERRYRGSRRPVVLQGRTVIVVDDGLATGSTMSAAVAAIARCRPARVVVAVPVASTDACQQLAEHADEVVCPWTPDQFVAVGQAYVDFSPVTDDEVARLLHRIREIPDRTRGPA